MNLFDYITYHYLHKWLNESDKLAEKRKEEKYRQKFEKKRIIEQFGYNYYLRDKLWNKIKDQKPKENYQQWVKRLSIYGFSSDGKDLKTGEEHYSHPLVHDIILNNTNKIGEKMETNELDESIIKWGDLLKKYLTPKEIKTCPLHNQKGKYFYVCSLNKSLYIYSGNTEPACCIKGKRKLNKEELSTLYHLYKKRGSLEFDYHEMINCSRNSSYWFGVFVDMGL